MTFLISLHAPREKERLFVPSWSATSRPNFKGHPPYSFQTILPPDNFKNYLLPLLVCTLILLRQFLSFPLSRSSSSLRVLLISRPLPTASSSNALYYFVGRLFFSRFWVGDFPPA